MHQRARKTHRHPHAHTRQELRADTTEAQEEAGKFEKQVADLQALREKERVLASRAVQDVKALRQEVGRRRRWAGRGGPHSVR
jgi:hypothetical protein